MNGRSSGEPGDCHRRDGRPPSQKPLLLVIMEALHERGWTIDKSGYIDPEGTAHPTVEAAIVVQTFREIATQDRSPDGT